MTVSIAHLEAYLLDHYGEYASEQGLFMKLVEEVGEIAEILNQRAGRKHSSEKNLDQDLAKELADLIHYTVALAAINRLDLNSVILEKDREASLKYQHRINLEDFIKSSEERI